MSERKTLLEIEGSIEDDVHSSEEAEEVYYKVRYVLEEVVADLEVAAKGHDLYTNRGEKVKAGSAEATEMVRERKVRVLDILREARERGVSRHLIRRSLVEQGRFEWLKENSALFRGEQFSDLIDWLLVDEAAPEEKKITLTQLSEDEATLDKGTKRKVELEGKVKSFVNDFKEWFFWQRELGGYPPFAPRDKKYDDLKKKVEGMGTFRASFYGFLNREVRNKEDEEKVIEVLREELIYLMKDAIGDIEKNGGTIVSFFGGEEVWSYLNFIRNFGVKLLDKNEATEIDRMFYLVDKTGHIRHDVAESDWRGLIDKLRGRE